MWWGVFCCVAYYLAYGPVPESDWAFQKSVGMLSILLLLFGCLGLAGVVNWVRVV
jgi:hypothetical protein